MTEAVFRDDPYCRSLECRIVAVNERGGIVLDRTIFYPTGGGQPGDSGILRLGDGTDIVIATTVKGEAAGEIVHVPAEGQPRPGVGEEATLILDWERRHRHMRMHSCLHLLSAVLPYPVTGGSVGAAKGRLDFDIAEAGLDKEAITARLNEMIASDRPVTTRWISDEELAAQPELVKTMAVKPPSGQGRVRLVEIEGLDLQPCGGTHVASTGEIGAVRVAKIEKKGRQNRRVSIVFDE